MFISSFEQGSVSLYLCSSFPPPRCPWPSFARRQFFGGCISLLSALGIRGGVMLKLSQGGPARLSVSVLKHFVLLPCASQQCCWQHGAGTLKGTCHALLIKLIKLICFIIMLFVIIAYYLCQGLHVTLQTALTSLVGNHLVK